jgi:hypothetical protein
MTPTDPWEDGAGFELKHLRTVAGFLFLLVGIAYAVAIIYRLAVHGEKPGLNDIGFLSALIIPGILMFNAKLGIEVLQIIGNKIKKDAE